MNTAILFNKGFRRAALVSVVAFGAFGTSNSFAAAVSDSAATSATVVQPIAIAQAQDLAFGEFSAGTGGTVVLGTGGAATATDDVVLTGGSPAAAQFTVTGQDGASFSIAVTDTELTYTDESSVDHTMSFATVHDLDGSAEDKPTTGNTLSGGTQTIYVGGTLTVETAQQPGLYKGTVTAEVNYE